MAKGRRKGGMFLKSCKNMRLPKVLGCLIHRMRGHGDSLKASRLIAVMK